MPLDYAKLDELLEQKSYSVIKSELEAMEYIDIAGYIDEQERQKSLLLFRLLKKDAAADVFSYLSPEKQVELSEMVSEKEFSQIMEDLYFDDKIDLLEEMPANVVKKILKNTNENERKLINQFLMYPEYSAGSLMTIEFVDLKKEMLIKEVFERIRNRAPDRETVYTCYVIDAKRRLEGTLSLKNIVLADPDKTVASLMRKYPIFVNTHDDQEYIADIFKRYDLLAVPVTDKENRLVGIITIDDIVDVIEKENSEDFYKMAAVIPAEEEYIDAGIFYLAKKRILWLLVLMISATFTGYIIRRFEDTLSLQVALAAFIPMLMDTGGNAGSQASTLVIRSIVLGEITFKDLLRVIWKEIRISMLVGTGLALLNFLRIYLLEGYQLEIALSVAATLIFTVLAAKILGGILPLIAKKIKIDPAVMAGPLITTIVDAISLVTYFYFAALFLGIN